MAEVPILQDKHFINESLLSLTLGQVRKDFYPIEINWEGLENDLTFESLIECLEPIVKNLLSQQSELFFQVIYRIDIKEQLIKSALTSDQPYRIVASLILKRELQKIVIREYFNKK